MPMEYKLQLRRAVAERVTLGVTKEERRKKLLFSSNNKNPPKRENSVVI